MEHITNGSDHNSRAQLIELRQAVKTYQSVAGSFTARKAVDLQIDRSEFVAIIGESGSGKSTLVNMITDIDRLGQHRWSERMTRSRRSANSHPPSNANDAGASLWATLEWPRELGQVAV